MSDYRANYEHISRAVFNTVSDRVRTDGLDMHVTISYNGTSLYGDLEIEGQVGYGKEFKKALCIFNEEYCK